MMNERTYGREYETDYNRDYYGDRAGKRSGARRGGYCGGRPGEAERIPFYETYQIPLMILGSFLSGALLIIGALA